MAGRTVMVRGLPPSARAPDLEGEFSRAGPLRRAVVVTEPGKEEEEEEAVGWVWQRRRLGAIPGTSPVKGSQLEAGAGGPFGP